MLTEKAKGILDQEWSEVQRLSTEDRSLDPALDSPLLELIRSSVNSKTKTYRYVLLTQVLAKCADASLDCRCLQTSRGGRGAFDARTIAHSVVVPFDQANENVLGGSPEPYVNNPLRVPEVSQKYRAAQKDREGWDGLCEVLSRVEKNQSSQFSTSVLRHILTEILRRLSTVKVVYPTPRRVSLRKALEVIQTFAAVSSGGDRLLALTSSLFVIIGTRFGLYSEVRRAKITAADQASGMLADLECLSPSGEVVMVVEVKDRQITVSQIRAKMRTIRQRQVAEIFFIAQGTSETEQTEVHGLVDKEFTSGNNIYITDFISLSRAALSLAGENGRRQFLEETSRQLEKHQSDIVHRRAWATLLASV